MTTASRTRAQLLSLRPGRDDSIDAAFLLLLILLALVGFRSTFSGWTFLVVGMVGALIGLGIGHLAIVLRQPMIAVVGAAIAAYFLLGSSVALHSQAIAGFLPSGGTFQELAKQSVGGWKDLLTTLPPVDGTGPLLVLPYLLGIIVAAGGYTIARRVSLPVVAVITPAALLVGVILLGAQRPSHRLLSGSVFAIACLTWIGLRAARRRPAAQNAAGRRGRILTSGALLAAAGLISSVAGTGLPGATGKRVVLRSYVNPPFDIGQYPSPLAGFRKYTAKPDYFGLNEATLFTIHGLPPGTNYVRIATLDSYDGLVWKASNQGGTQQPLNAYQRVGSEIPSTTTGKQVVLQVTVDRYHDVWLPTVGDTVGVTFHGSDANTHSNDFRYNLATGTGVLPDIAQKADTYTLKAIIPHPGGLTTGQALAGSPPVTGAVTAFTATAIKQWSSGSKRTDPISTLLAVAAWMHANGGYTDGQGDESVFLPGHSVKRLTSMVNQAAPGGNDEQYAALLALVANQLGIDARVVFGATPESNGDVKGKDVHAWIEVAIAGHGWVPIYPDQFVPPKTNRVKVPTPPQNTTPKQTVVPPPVGAKPPAAPLEASDAGTTTHAVKKASHPAAGSGFHLPAFVITTLTFGGPPILLILLVFAAIIGMKARRRRHRRLRGPVTRRLARGWYELLDTARDLGETIPSGLTRRQQARLLQGRGIEQLGRDVDTYVFGPGEPSEQLAAGFWSEVDSARSRMARSAGRWQRFRAAISLTSLREPSSTGSS